MSRIDSISKELNNNEQRMNLYVAWKEEKRGNENTQRRQ